MVRDATEHGRKVITDDHGLTRRFIPAKATDNPYLDEAYFRRLDSIPDPARRAAIRPGIPERQTHDYAWHGVTCQ